MNIENKFIITIEDSDGNKEACRLDDIFKAADSLSILFYTNYAYGKPIDVEKHEVLTKRINRYKEDYSCSVFDINEEYENKLNEKMYGK